MKIDRINYIKLYYDTNVQGADFALPEGGENLIYKLSVRETDDWRTPSMCDAVGVVDAVAKTVTFTINTFTQEFERVCRIQDTAYLEIYTDAANSKEVFLQRQIFIGSRVGSIAGHPPVPSDEYVMLKTEMPTASAGYLNDVVFYAGETTSSFTKGHFYKCEQSGSSYVWTDITDAQQQEQADWTESDPNSRKYIQHKPNLAAVATSGDYADLSNKPTIPTALSDLSEDTEHQTVTSAQKSTWNGKQDAITSENKLAYSLISGTPTIPTALADLSEDSIHQTVTESQKSTWNGKADLENGKVPASQLPSYVDDVLEFSSTSAFPATGESGKIYVALDTNKTYRWGGTEYVEISASLALGETSDTAFPGNRGKATEDGLSSHVANTSNPHSVTAAQVGLGNVDNTSDANKPISTAQQTALNAKITEPSGRVANKVLGTDDQNNLVWKASGQQIITVTATSGTVAINPIDGEIYKYTAAASETVVIATSALTSSNPITFELWITQPSTAIAFALPVNIKWGDGEDFSSSGTAPDLSAGSYQYRIRIMWDGEELLGHMYAKKAMV